MQIRTIWETVNVSTVLILPLFEKYFKKVRIRGQEKLKYPFVQLLIEYGLINTYLYYKKVDDKDLSKDKREYNLYLLFNRSMVHNLMSTTSLGWLELNSYILGSNNFKSLVYLDSNYIVYSLNIPEEYNDDIKTILSSKYSKVSKEYKEILEITQKKLPKTENIVGLKISEYNVAFSIVTKSGKLKEEIIENLKTSLSDEEFKEIEFYPKFNKSNETFSLDCIYQNGISNLQLELLDNG